MAAGLQTDLTLAQSLMGAKKYADAVAVCTEVLKAHPRNPYANEILGLCEMHLGQMEKALVHLRESCADLPGNAVFAANLGAVCRSAGEAEESVRHHQRAVKLDPDNASYLSNLGEALTGVGRVEEAIRYLERAATLAPTYAPALNNLGSALRQGARLEESYGTLRRCLALAPDLAAAWGNLAQLLETSLATEECLAAYEQYCKLAPGDMDLRSNMLMVALSSPTRSPTDVFLAHREWGELAKKQAGTAGGQAKRVADRAPGRRLRIGYVSPDFRYHAVASFAESFLREHDHGQLEVTCYYASEGRDAMTARLQGYADRWRDVAALSDTELAGRVREDGIDILVDLAGHSSWHRLGAFALRAAPVQVTYLGYPATTGLSAIGYRLTDAIADPPGKTEGLYTEELVRLPETAWCYTAPEEAGEPSAVPSAAAGRVTFGSFNHLRKITPEMVGTWSAVLGRVAGSRMVVSALGLENPWLQQQVLKAFKHAGISGERVSVRGWVQDFAGHLRSYGEIDVVLDTFPYGGTTSTCEAMWMGVPVVTLAGETHASRVGASLLTNVGLGELVARKPEGYVRIAGALAGDAARLRDLRGSLRGRMQSSVLMDGKRFTRNMEAAYRRMWERYCGS